VATYTADAIAATAGIANNADWYLWVATVNSPWTSVEFVQENWGRQHLQETASDATTASGYAHEALVWNQMDWRMS